jgi:iron complex transport system substrate-binding protein
MIRAAGRALLLALLLIATAAPAADDAAPARRIVSLSPHLTELVFDAGAGQWLVGVVEHSDYPGEARQVPRVGDAFRIDRERLASTRPDLVLAWSGGTPQATIEQLRADGYRVELVETGDPEEIARTLERIAQLAGTGAVAAPLAERFRAGFAELARQFAGRSLVRVFVQITPRPLYTVGEGQVVDTVISLCGGTNVFGGIRQLAPVVTEEAVIAADPQVIIAPRVGQEDVLARWRRYGSMAAVQGGYLRQIDADLISRQSLRILQGAREICEVLQEAREAG